MICLPSFDSAGEVLSPSAIVLLLGTSVECMDRVNVVALWALCG